MWPTILQRWPVILKQTWIISMQIKKSDFNFIFVFCFFCLFLLAAFVLGADQTVITDVQTSPAPTPFFSRLRLFSV